VKEAIFISVRTGSSRLPNKAILEIGGRKTIEYLIERIKLATTTKNIVLCTTKLREDDVLCKIATNNNIKFYRGSSSDKLQRWLDAATHFKIDFFVNADGDDIFYDAPLADLCLKQLQDSNIDFVDGSGLYNDVYGIKTTALEQVCSIKDTDETEFIKPYFVDTGMFKVERLKNVPEIYKKVNIRMTLDYEDDLKFFDKIIDSLKDGKQYLSFNKILEFLKNNPDVIDINFYLDEAWKKNQQRLSKLVLKVAM